MAPIPICAVTRKNGLNARIDGRISVFYGVKHMKYCQNAGFGAI